LLHKWQTGQTGYPLVDASMRELWATGWVQQNMRMVSACFLTEYLNINWTEGARWYEDTLVDADLAINSMMWQNAGRSGADQWNFLISPEDGGTQDPTGSYVRRWIPEIAGLPNNYIHRPWEAPEQILRSAGVRLGENYPERCIENLPAAREIAKRSTISMRQQIADTWMNDPQGYDVIELPDGGRTVLFTKQEYRLGKDGHTLKPSATSGRQRGGQRNRQQKKPQSKNGS
jgi:hypothetical protein